jgi:rare lipoprotein A
MKHLATALALASCLAACASHAAEEGKASWYGNEFQGRRTASGERFDKEQMTAAHRTLPFGTLVNVRNLDAGCSAIVRINDRGPFARGRILDCSERAARELNFLGTGTAQVRLEVLGRLPGDGGEHVTKKERRQLERALKRAQREGPAAIPPGMLSRVDVDAGPFEVQVGAFRDEGNARRLAEKLTAQGHAARVVSGMDGFSRVRVGPYPSRAEAEAAAPDLPVDEEPFVVRADVSH